jgi:hypothetical protein
LLVLGLVTLGAVGAALGYVSRQVMFTVTLVTLAAWPLTAARVDAQSSPERSDTRDANVASTDG